jgi:hypothetical protein
MAQRRIYQIEFVTADGVRIEHNRDGWRIANVRGLGEATRLKALELLEEIEGHIMRPPADPADPQPMVTLCEQIAVRFKLRITHRRIKKIDR